MSPFTPYRKTLIVQGGGFRTAFSAGVLDAFLESHYCPFDLIVANSGGSIASSYFLAEQKGSYIEAMKFLANDPHFIQYSRFFKSKGLMDVDYFKFVANEVIPFDVDRALQQKAYTEVRFVATSCEDGSAHYLEPHRTNWMDTVIASCALPFLTKGSHDVEGHCYFDGGWSDALPVKWAYEQGARDILVLRTLPPSLKVTQSWSDWFGSILHGNKKVRHSFQNNHLFYNETVDFIGQPPLDLNLSQIAPEAPLKCSTYTKNLDHIEEDYAYGFALGKQYLSQIDFSAFANEVMRG